MNRAWVWYAWHLGLVNMSITDKTRKMLWGKAGSRCAKCKCELIEEGHASADDQAIIGDECHISAQSPTGPRYDAELPPEQVDAYENLILLCAACHRLVDAQPGKYTAERLRQSKKDHADYIRRGTEPRPDVGEADDTPPEPYGPDTVVKSVGVLWSRRLDIDERTVTFRFRGQLLAKVTTQNASGPTWHHLYRLHNGRFVVYIEHVHRNDYAEARLRGVNAWGEPDPPLGLRQLQEEFPALATAAGLSRVVDFKPE